ncbi:MAG: rhombosortase [Oleibacter sp.]|nr:rhombosortase [Thalassolituus sp.]
MKFYLFWAVLGLLCVVVMLGGNPVMDILRFDRLAIEQGQIWRLFTAHISHLSYAHAGMNLAALALTAYVADQRRTALEWSLCWVWLMGTTGLGLYLLAPDLYYYVGLSGALHGGLIAAIMTSPYYSARIRTLVVLVIVGKILWEQSPFYDDLANLALIGGRVESRAHLFGGIAGLIWGATMVLRVRISKHRAEQSVE